MMPAMQPNESTRPGFLDRLLGLERHEYYAVAWSFVYFFCILFYDNACFDSICFRSRA